MTCAAAVCVDGRGVETHEAPAAKSHSQTLLPLIRSLLEACGLTLGDIDAFAVSCGPGSFTGLRIGISTVKGLALANGRPAIGVPTLDAIAACAVLTEDRVCPILDARKGEVYAALYARHEGRLLRVAADRVVSPEELCELIREPTFFLGDGAERYGSILCSRLGGEVFKRADARPLPVASKVAELGAALLRARAPSHSIWIVPNYVRRSDAEINRERKRGGMRGL